MSTITLTIDNLPDNSIIESTSWQVYKTRDFTPGPNNEHVILDIAEDTEHKETIDFEFDLNTGEVVYGRYRHHYTNNTSDSWSYPIFISKEDKRYNYTGTIIGTPELFITSDINSNEDNIVVETSGGIVNFQGNVGLVATTWLLTDLAGITLWERTYDTFNKTRIEIPRKYTLGNEAVVIKCQLHGTDNSESNLGKLILAKDPHDAYISIQGDGNRLCYNRDMDIMFRYNEYNVKSLSYALIEVDGNEVSRGTIRDEHDLSLKTITIDNNGLKPNTEYDLHIMIKTVSNEVLTNEFRMVTEYCMGSCIQDKSLLTQSTTVSTQPQYYRNKYSTILYDNVVPLVKNGNIVILDFVNIFINHNPPVSHDFTSFIRQEKKLDLAVKGNYIYLTGFDLDDRMIVMKFKFYPVIGYLKVVSVTRTDIIGETSVRFIPFDADINGEKFDGGILVNGTMLLINVNDGTQIPINAPSVFNSLDNNLVALCNETGYLTKIIKLTQMKFYFFTSLHDAKSKDSVDIPDIDKTKPFALISRDKTSASFIAYSNEDNTYVLYRIKTTNETISVEKEQILGDKDPVNFINIMNGEIVYITEETNTEFTWIKG